MIRSAARLTTLRRPFIVAVITERTVERSIATMGASAIDGADAFELNLPALADTGGDTVAAIVAAAPRPVYVSCRRQGFMAVYGLASDVVPPWPDDERMDRQLAALAAGAVAIDIEMDTFDPRPAPPLGTEAADRFAGSAGDPAELSREPEAVDRQREVVAATHAAGAEVILSCHTGRPQTVAGLVAIVDEAIERGADLVKIVTPCADRADLFAVLEANALVATRQRPPSAIIGAGQAGAIGRSVGGAFGAAWLIGRPADGSNPFPGQPTVADLAAISSRLPSGPAGRHSGRT